MKILSFWSETASSEPAAGCYRAAALHWPAQHLKRDCTNQVFKRKKEKVSLSYHHSQHLLNAVIQNRIFHGSFHHDGIFSMLHRNDDVGHRSRGFSTNGYLLPILLFLGGGAADIILCEQIHAYLGDQTEFADT